MFQAIVVIIGLLFMLTLVSSFLLVKPYQIPSGSTLPTIRLNDRVIADRIIYHFKAVERGDVIVFNPPPAADAGGSSAPIVKRVIAVGGDTVEIRGGRVLVNGSDFVVEGATPPSYLMQPETVPAGQLFVLGDNRDESYDSHRWGFLPEQYVTGRVEFIYYPPSDIKTL